MTAGGGPQRRSARRPWRMLDLAWRRRFVAVIGSLALMAVLYSAQSPVNPQRPQLAAVGASPAAWGTLPRADLFPIVFSSAMSERHFRDWMRMSRYTFDQLADRLGRTPTYRAIFDEDGLPCPNAAGPRRKTTLRKEVATCIYVLSGNESFHRVSTLWEEGVASTRQVHQILRRFVKAVNSIANEYIFWPDSNEEAQQVVDGIEAIRGLPNCIGIIDCTHVEIPGCKAMGDRTRYISYKKRYTLILQAVVDGSGAFTHCVAGYPGSLNDCTIFAKTDVYERLRRTIYRPDYPGKYLLSDSGFVLRIFCMRGFAYDSTDDQERVLNAYCHSTRATVEHTFGRMKGRFRRLKFLNVDLKLAPQVMHACAVLHNFISHHDGEDDATPLMTQRDAELERTDPRTSTKIRLRLRHRALRIRLQVPARAAAHAVAAAAAAAAAAGLAPPVPNPLGDLEAGKRMREELKAYLWDLHLQREEDRVALFSRAFARGGDSDSEAEL